MGNRDTAARVQGVSRCAKNLDRTRTCGTCFGSTAGLTVPVLNAMGVALPNFASEMRPSCFNRQRFDVSTCQFPADTAMQGSCTLAYGTSST